MNCRILFLISEDWFFLSHRLDLALFLKKNGFDVAVACKINKDEETIKKYGFLLFDIQVARKSTNFIYVIKESSSISKIIKAYNPDIALACGLRMIMLCWLATFIYSKSKTNIVNFMLGRGSLFAGKTSSVRLVISRFILSLNFPLFFNRKNTYNLFLNKDDLSLFVNHFSAPPERSFRIPGPGINTSSWIPVEELLNSPPVILYIGRIIRDKGIQELVEASSILKSRNINHILQIAGRIDSCNPNAFSQSDIEHWKNNNDSIQWLGHRNNVMELISSVNIIAMPSYLEGFGRVLLETALAKRAVVTCDTVGCRDAVAHMDNGLLVPPYDAYKLADMLELLIKDNRLRKKLAARNYERVINEFSNEQIFPACLKFFKAVVNPELYKKDIPRWMYYQK